MLKECLKKYINKKKTFFIPSQDVSNKNLSQYISRYKYISFYFGKDGIYFGWKKSGHIKDERYHWSYFILATSDAFNSNIYINWV